MTPEALLKKLAEQPETLDLSKQRLTSEQAKTIGEWLQTNPATTTLNLSSNFLGDKSASYILQALTGPSAAITPYSEESTGTPNIEEELPICSNTILTELNIQGAGLTAEIAGSIAEMLKTNTSLTSLNISGNRFNKDAAMKIAEAVADNYTLRHLYMANNRFNCSISTFSKIFQNDTLEEVELSGNLLQPESQRRNTY